MGLDAKQFYSHASFALPSRFSQPSTDEPLCFPKHVEVKRAAEGEDLGKSFEEAVDETETALIVSIRKVLHRTGLKPCQVRPLLYFFRDHVRV